MKRINPSHSDIQSVLTSGIFDAIEGLEKGSNTETLQIQHRLEALLIKAAKMQLERECKIALRAEKQVAKAAKAEARKAVGRKATV